jgi:alkaline phosphatase D
VTGGDQRHGLSRRTFLVGTATAIVLGACASEEAVAPPDTTVPPAPPRTGSPHPAPDPADIPDPVDLPADPFTLGVASGDPDTASVILWTRLALEPLVDGGGMPETDVPVEWEVATDEGIADVVASGTAVARAERAHAVHVDADGLEAGRWYWYRFRTAGYESRVGRTRTMPSAGDQATDRFAFAFASCQHYGTGYYTAYRHMAEEDLDLVVHLGDYIYEGRYDGGPRSHEGGEVDDLAGYRRRHAQYKTDEALQAAHARFPWALTWDDHEVVNNYAGDTGSSGGSARFLERRAAAYRAWWEHLPVRLPPPEGAELPIFRRVEAGDLATFHLLDQRQYRSPIACATIRAGAGPICDDAEADDHTMLGDDQQRWLADGLGAANSHWQVLAQGVVMSELDLLAPIRPKVVNLDQWDGYPLARRQVLEAVQAAGADAVVISGDIHASIVGDLYADFDDTGGTPVATEFVGTAISSAFPDELRPVLDTAVARDDHLHWADHEHRGYVRCTLTPEEYRTDYRLVDTVRETTSAIRTASSWRVRPGRPGAERI